MTSTEFSSTEDILGRADANDLDAILAVPNPYVDGVVHQVKDNADAIFTWDYEKGARPALSKLYEKAKKSQWNGETDLDWSLDVDQEALARMAVTAVPAGPELDLTGTCFEKFNDDDWTKVNIEMQNWTLSQFMHGEQGALICTAKIVETVPWIDAKYYAATQVMDEARHVEVFAKYL
ncbi:MAG: ferritin-like domain-containing protein, partial [Acidimicrobiales bacterium]